MRTNILSRCSYRSTLLSGGLLALLFTAATGCNVRVDKTGDGDNVKIATPFGEIAVNKDLTSASDLGLPAYPGAVVDSGGDGHKSAKVNMGFGSFHLRVKMANYATSDNREQVLAFYRKALSQYGGVLECADGQSFGPQASNSNGLTCDHSGKDHGATVREDEAGDLELKSGSEHHQHLLVLHKGGKALTRFTLIALDLPHGLDNEEKGTN